MTHEAVIPKHNVDWLIGKVETINKRARKIGVPEMVLTVEGAAGFRTVSSGFGTKYQIPLVKVVLTGEIPHIDGWNLIARLNRTPAGNVISSVPGAPAAPARARTFYGCDHCGHKRFRKDIFVLEKDGEHKIVGRTCLQDFFGGKSPDVLMNYARLIDRFINESAKAERDEPVVRTSSDAIPLDLILTYTLAEIEVFGWYPASKGIRSTKSAVQNYIVESAYGRNRFNEITDMAASKGLDPFGPAARIKIDAATEWAITLDPKNDYEWNLRTIARAGFVTFRQIGYAVSLIPTFERQRTRQAVPAVQAVSNHLGSIGDRLEVTGRVVFVNSYDTNFGVRTLVKVRTDNGDVVNWWSPALYNYTNNENTPIAKDDLVKIRGRVKSHDEYKGQKQTTVNYAKMEIL